jgi:SHS2 domain-containing protein
MEVQGKTIRELIENLLKEINENVKGYNPKEEFSTKFNIKCKNMEECIQKFGEKILNYFNRKNVIFDKVEIEVTGGRKWILSFSLKGKTFEKLEAKIKEIKIEGLEESLEGWKLTFSMK